MSAARVALLSMAGFVVLAACAAPATPGEAEIAQRIDAAVEGTVDALASTAPPSTLPPAATPAPTQPSTDPAQPPTATSTLIPTETLPPAPVLPMISVSRTTNCRTGPGRAYRLVSSLRPGEAAQVTGRSSVEGYWYITHPDPSEQPCWLWDQYATLQGNTASLPVLTPEPAPVQQIDFTLYLHSFSECGSPRVSLTVVNTGPELFRSGRIHVEDLDSGDDLHGPRLDPHPFADNPSSCPRDEGSNSLPPGATAYLVIPLSEYEGGDDAEANIRLCTDDDGEGECVSQSISFQLPSD